MLLQLLSLLDLFAAITILFHLKQFAPFLFLFLLSKGVFTLISTLNSFDILGVFLGLIDLVGAFLLYSILMNLSYSFLLALCFILKAIYCFVVSFRF